MTDQDQQLVRFVAAKVLGWEEAPADCGLPQVPGRRWWCEPGTDACRAFNPLTSADDDYRVLCAVREGWDNGMKGEGDWAAFGRIDAFCASLRRIQKDRTVPDNYQFNDGDRPLKYIVGDFSRAAAAVLGFTAAASGASGAG